MARVAVGVIGLGRGATLTVPALLAHPRLRVVAGADPDPAAREGFARQTGAATHGDAMALIADPAVQAVYVASPHELHADHAIAAARAGKHELVEKPMAVTLADAAAMVAAADAAGVVLLVGPSHGYDPQLALADELIAARVGPVRMIQAMNWTDFLDRPRRPAELDRAQGGGVVFSQASHQIDVVRRLAGRRVTKVRGWVGGWHATHRTDGAYAAQLWFEGGTVAMLSYSGHGHWRSDALYGGIGEMGAPAPRPVQNKAARGFAGAILPDAPPRHHERFGFVLAACAHGDLELTPDGVTLHDAAGSHPLPAPLPAVQRLAVADAFARAVLDGERTGLDGRWGLETLACCHALIRSAEEGRDVAPADLVDQLETG